MADIYDGDIEFMRDYNPNQDDLDDGQIFRSREASAPKRESIFMWDPTPYVGPLYFNAAINENEVPQYVGFAPDYLETVWGTAVSKPLSARRRLDES